MLFSTLHTISIQELPEVDSAAVAELPNDTNSLYSSPELHLFLTAVLSHINVSVLLALKSYLLYG